MSTLLKSYHFASNSDGLFDIGISGAFTFAFDGTTGSPGAGSGKFTFTSLGTSDCKCRTNVGFTWEDFGIPTGATVTNLRVISWNGKSQYPSAVDFLVYMRFLNGGTKVTTLDLVQGITPTTSFTSLTVSGLQNVLSSYQASNTFIQFEIECHADATGNPSFTWVDEIIVEITYSGGTVGGTKMPERASIYEASQIGVETTAGVAVAATKRMLCTEMDVDPVFREKAYKPMGFKFNTGMARGKGYTNVRYMGDLCFNDLPYILSGLLLKPTPTTPTNNSLYTVTGATGTFGATFVDPVAGSVVLTAATFANAAALKAGIEALTNVGKGGVNVYMATGALWATGAFTIEFVGPKSAAGMTITTATGAPVPVITVGSAAAGTVRRWSFVPSYNSPDTIQTYTLEKGIPGVATLAQQIPGVAFSSCTIRINETEASISGDGFGLDLLEAPASSFNMTALTAANDLAPVPVDPASVSVWLSSASYADAAVGVANLGRLLRPLEFEMVIGGRQRPLFTLNDQDTSYSSIIETGPNIDVRLVLEHDAQGQQAIANAKAELIQYLTVEAKGGAISGVGAAIFPYRIRIQIPVKWLDPTRADSAGVYASTLAGSAFYDGGTGLNAFTGGVKIDVDVNYATL